MKIKIIISIILIASIGILNAQTRSQRTIPLIGAKAPSFKAETTNGTLRFPDDFGNSWKMLFSHPKDFTPVCTHEILHLALMQDQFEELGVKIAILSVDNLETHELWKKSMEEILSKRAAPVKINFPFIDDDRVEVSKLYGMLHETASDSRNVRGVFIIGPENTIEAIYFYPLTVGRNLDEIVRTIQALQTVKASKLVTPANWRPYNDLLVPYYPYTEEELIKRPELLNEYYQIGSFLWYKRNLKP